MPEVLIELGPQEKELLGTENREEIKDTLEFLAEIVLGGVVDQLLLPPPQGPSNE